MSVTLAEVRQAIAAKIAAIGSTWWEAPVPYEQFGPDAVPDAVPSTKAHLAFSVGLLSTERGGEGYRDRSSSGMLLDHLIGVKFLAKHTPGPTNSLASFDAALTAEHDLMKAVMAQGASYPIQIKIRFDRTESRTLDGGGNWYVFSLRFLAMHQLSLT